MIMAAPALVLGTAGHIDHGKSSLIKALTGTDPDRLAQEKERGITIELGFARLDLPSGRSMGVVDVPGHEKFVRQMVAGATGIDVVLLVVAADDGIMPQTREHLAIIDLLGIDRGVVALTKSDLVDQEWLDLVSEEIESLLEGTSIEAAPVVPVSSKSGVGLDALREALDAIAVEAPGKHSALPLRVPVDRVFTIAGAGTVVTGTLWSGSASRDDAVQLYPSGREGRLRGVQVHGASVEKALAGQRVALNIVGLDTDQISRGDIVAAPGSLTVTDRFDARLTYLGAPGEDKPFETGARVHVHHGTREVLGRVLLMDGDRLQRGESAFAQIRLEEPLAPRYDDRFIIRSYSPVYTIGGGVVLDALPPRRTTLKGHERELLEALVNHDLAAASVGLLAARGIPMTSAQVASALGLPRAQVADDLNRAKLERLKVGADTYFVDPGAVVAHVASIERELLAFHEAEPRSTGIAAPALRDRVDRRLTGKVFDALLDRAIAQNHAQVRDGRVSHPDAAVTAHAEEERATVELLALLEGQGLAPASLADLAREVGVEQKVAVAALGKLNNSGRIVRLSGDLYFSRTAVDAAIERVRVFLQAHPPATTSELREALGVSRKYAIPLLEYLDTHGVTRREGDVRSLQG